MCYTNYQCEVIFFDDLSWIILNLKLTFANPDSGYISLACIFHVLLSYYNKGGFPGGSDGKASACNAGDLGSAT